MLEVITAAAVSVAWWWLARRCRRRRVVEAAVAAVLERCEVVMSLEVIPSAEPHAGRVELGRWEGFATADVIRASRRMAGTPEPRTGPEPDGCGCRGCVVNGPPGCMHFEWLEVTCFGDTRRRYVQGFARERVSEPPCLYCGREWCEHKNAGRDFERCE